LPSSSGKNCLLSGNQAARAHPLLGANSVIARD
jgi:hypothetical protein